MSVICAIFSPDGLGGDESDTMLASLAAYPHDSKGSWTSDHFALAACTLHTDVESRGQTNPFLSDDGRVAALFDGYLLNPDELASDLLARGAVLRSRTDVELALRAYEAWGERCSDRLQGEFALVVADERSGRLFATRDHFGFVPLYFLRDGTRLIVSSDYRSIAALYSRPLEPNLRYLAQIIANRWYLRGETPWKQINRLKRSYALSFDGMCLTEERYWTPPTDVTIRYASDAEYAEHYREVLFDSVRRASRSDQDVGIAVSGGLDSSALFVIAHALEQKGQLLAPGFRGYSLAAEEGSNAYELPYARAAAEHVGRDLCEVPLFDPDIEWYQRDARWHLDFAIPSNAAMMLAMDEQIVKDGSRILINGTGGDEWLQGNAHIYAEFLDDRDLTGFARVLGREISKSGFASAAGQCLRQTASWLSPDAMRNALRRRLRESRRNQDLALSSLAPELRTVLAEAEEEYEATLPDDPIEWSKVNLTTTPRADLSHSVMRRLRDRTGLQARNPMLSRAFIEFSLKTPAHIKRRGESTKVIHRQAMAPYLPAKVLNRTTKANFTNTQIDHQFAEFVRSHGRELLHEMCNFEGLPRILEINFLGPEGDYWAWEIWGLYASAAFLYQTNHTGEVNPATGVQLDRKN